jgi:acyl carrier protein
MGIELFKRVKKIIVAFFGVEESRVTPEASFVDDLWADSFDMVELFINLEMEFNIDISNEAAEKVVTVKDVIELIEKL